MHALVRVLLAIVLTLNRSNSQRHHPINYSYMYRHHFIMNWGPYYISQLPIPLQIKQLMLDTCSVLSLVLSFEMPSLETIRDRISKLMSDLARLTPERYHACIVHILRHFPDQIEIWGPTKHFWMYAYERSDSSSLYHAHLMIAINSPDS